MQRAIITITESGIERFREIESAALAELTKRSGIVLATGGGAVTIPANRAYLRQNGPVFFIERDLSLLATDGRPLSAGGIERIKALYAERLPLYRALSDFTVTADGVLSTAQKIRDLL